MTGTIVALVLLALVLYTVSRTVRIVPQASVFVIERLGRYSRTLNPGIHLLAPVVDKVRVKVDIREQVVGFPPQSACRWRIPNPWSSTLPVMPRCR